MTPCDGMIEGVLSTVLVRQCWVFDRFALMPSDACSSLSTKMLFVFRFGENNENKDKNCPAVPICYRIA